MSLGVDGKSLLDKLTNYHQVNEAISFAGVTEAHYCWGWPGPRRGHCLSLRMEFKVATVIEVTCWPSCADIEMCWRVLLRLSVCLMAISPRMDPNMNMNFLISAATPCILAFASVSCVTWRASSKPVFRSRLRCCGYCIAGNFRMVQIFCIFRIFEIYKIFENKNRENLNSMGSCSVRW